MYTLFLKYTTDPNKLSAWKEYAQAEFAPMNKQRPIIRIESSEEPHIEVADRRS